MDSSGDAGSTPATSTDVTDQQISGVPGGHNSVMEIELTRGDITGEAVDAIVNAAKTTLLGGAGVDGAIHMAAGPELVKACRLLGGCEVGAAKATPGFNLLARWVIHTVGPRWSGGSSGEAELLRSCYIESLKRADELGAMTVSFPAIATGIYGYPIEAACEIAIEAVRSATTAVQVVRFVVFDEDNARAYRSRLG